MDHIETNLSPLEHYRVVRSQIEHEDDLVSQRLSWFLASQAFLFTAYAISLNGPTQLHFQNLEAQAKLLMILLPLLAIASALLIWISVLAGVSAMRTLRMNFERSAGKLPAQLPSLQTAGRALLGGQLGPVFIPPMFIAVWLILLLRT
jgi:hypothetical protein